MHYADLRSMIIAFSITVLAGLVYWAAARPSRETSRLGMRGLKRQQCLLRHPLWAGVEPLIRWLGVRVSGMLDARSRDRLDAQLTWAGDFLGMTAEEYFASSLFTVAIGLSLGAAASWIWNDAVGWTPIPFLMGMAAPLPRLVVDAARARRFKAINRGLPYAIDLMALCMSAGLDFPGSVQQVVEKSKANDALREELAYVLQQLQLGRTRAQALRELAARVPLETVAEFVQALVQAEERGNPVAAALEIQAGTSRTRRSNQAEKAAANMKAKMVLPIMMLVSVGMILVTVSSTMMVDKFVGAMK